MVTPQITSNRYLVLRFLHKHIHKFALMCSNLKILDLGCGRKPYLSYFVHPQLYIGVDENSQLADVIAVAENLPVRSSYFDVVLCTQVLEHVEETKKVLKEIRRVLEVNGRLVLSTHGFWIEEHEPTDYWRWTFQGLRKILGECGFSVIKHASMEPIISLFQMMLLFIPQRTIFVPVIVLTNIIAMVFKKFVNNRGPKLYSVHFIIAKPLE